jgi:hypothetical protein
MALFNLEGEMKSIFLIMCVCLSGIFSAPPRQDYPPLPSELAFIALLGQDGPYSINLVDRETLEPYEIYRSEVYIHSINWSPQGDLLAITQGNRFVSEVCILTIEGALQRCLSESPLWYTAPLLVRNTPLTWSSDGTKIYYTTQDGEMRRLIEVDIQTSETLQTIYEMEESNEYVNMTWTPDLKYILISTSPSGRVPTTLVNRETGETQIVEDIVVPYLDELEPHTETQVCPDFSPQNHYLTSITYTDYFDGSYYGSQMVIFDPAGTIIHTIASPDHLLYCPAWMFSDDSFYLFRRNNREEWMGIFTLYRLYGLYGLWRNRCYS